jgi:anti-anti-sigma factor
MDVLMAASPTPLTILARTPVGAETVLDIAGEIDASTAEAFTLGVLDSIQRAGDGCVITLDMSAVDFVDSTGVKALLECRNALPLGTRLTVCNPSPPVARLFQLTKIDDLFYEDELLAS